MVAPHADTIVADYLRRLDGELQGLPGARRREIVTEIEEHIAAARERVVDESDADLLTILDRVGDPADIAAEAARQRFDGEVDEDAVTVVRQPGLMELLAVLLIGTGNLVVPFGSWVVGAVLVWFSPCWRGRDKGIAVRLSLVGVVVIVGGRARFDSVAGGIVVGLALVLPVAASLWLASRLPQRRAAGARAGVALVSAIIVVPIAVSLMPVRTYGFVGADGPPGMPVSVHGNVHCGGFYGTTSVGGAHAPLNLGICWDGQTVRKVWGPDCGVSYGPFVVGASHSCTARQVGDGGLIVTSDVDMRAATSPVFNSSRTMTWHIGPDGIVEQLAP